MINSRFTVAIHVLCLLAHSRGQAVTSEHIAGSVNTNPVVIRRLLAALREAGLVRSQGGTAGGWELVKDPRQTTLLEIYRMVKPGTVFALHNKEPNPRCPIGRNIQQRLRGYYQRVQEAMEKELSQISIAEVLGGVLGLRRS